METQTEVKPESVRRAFRAATLIRRSGVPVAVVTLLLAAIGFAVHAALGMLVIVICLLCMVCVFVVLSVQAKCPQCKTRWWDNTFVAATTGRRLRAAIDPDCTGNETVELKCRHCRLEIAPYLK
ncbi:MAG: hypothetical protein QGH42_01835 [Kiritimatiellia bacterium]|jgi:hypothetical protein|nr:hypothetical protein [Kiritimatiellia bacterium]MDP6809238.1 hypothetical protein [Kiritimatiellia bacterium]MDP7022977.1 hypothetical protein [Kiritimatiellia bacterium]